MWKSTNYTAYEPSPRTEQVTSQLPFCGKCGEKLQPRFRFCPICGSTRMQSSDHSCSCGMVITPKDQFCRSCGKATG